MTKITLYDNTRIVSHRGCNRRYYYRHIRHLAGTGTAPALVFGAAWHKAMDAVWTGVLFSKGMTNTDILLSATLAFMDEWQSQGLPPFEEMPDDQKYIFTRSKRTPEIAARMLAQYIGKREPQLRKMFTLIQVESPFLVPIYNHDEVLYVGRIDKVVEWNGGLWGIEHKTTSQGSSKSGFYKAWTEQWSPNSQVDGYIHALNMVYGPKVRGILIDGALVHRTDSHFDFIPIDRQIDQLEGWHYDLTTEISRIDENKKAQARSTGPSMQAWPKNTGTCIEYNSVCAYSGFCKMIANPAALSDEELTRNGLLKIQKWSPFDAAPLENLGLTRSQTGE